MIDKERLLEAMRKSSFAVTDYWIGAIEKGDFDAQPEPPMPDKDSEAYKIIYTDGFVAGQNSKDSPTVKDSLKVGEAAKTEDCDCSRGDTQCDYILPQYMGHLCCRYKIGHAGNHHTSYSFDSSRQEDWKPRPSGERK